MSRRLFIASSKEGAVYAETIRSLLNNTFRSHGYAIDCVLWDDLGSIFLSGGSNLEDLERYARDLGKDGGYAVAMVTPDDVAWIRGQKQSIMRDNVLFEFGLFLGRLGRRKVFAVLPKYDEADIKKPIFWTPTDLSGITTASYRYLGEHPERDAVIETLRKAVMEIGAWIAKFERQKRSESKDDKRSEYEREPFGPIW